MRTTFANLLCEEAKNNKNIELLTGDLGFGVLKDFIENYPSQYTNCGIAEQNMLSVAGGMASMGKEVIVYSIGNFPTFRALEQIRNDICYYNHNVKIVCIGGGYTYGSLGMSHHATEDIAIMRAMPNMTIFAPSDKFEAIICVKKMFEINGPCYLRLERDSNFDYHNKAKLVELYNLQPILLFNSNSAIITYGTIIEESFNLANEKKIDLYTMPCLKPIYKEKIVKVLKNYQTIFCVEEHSIIGGLGDIISNIVAEDHKLNCVVVKIGIQDKFLSDVGTQKYMRKCAGIDSESIGLIISKCLKYENFTN